MVKASMGFKNGTNIVLLVQRASTAKITVIYKIRKINVKSAILQPKIKFNLVYFIKMEIEKTKIKPM